MGAFAAEEDFNILNSIQIDALNNTYSILLDSDKNLDLKRVNQSPDNMILVLKNTVPAKSLNTIYKNAVEVDSIIVEATSNNSLKIMIKAKNIANAAVSTNSKETELQAINQKSVLTPRKIRKPKKDYISLAAPVEDYRPIYKEDIDDMDDSFDLIPSFGFIEKIKNILSSGNNSNILTTGFVALILFCIAKLFKGKKQEPVVGLSQSLKEREINLYKDILRSKSDLNNNHLGYSAYSAQQQQPKRTLNTNAGYGIRAYKSSLSNPYMTSDIVRAANPNFNSNQQPKQSNVLSNKSQQQSLNNSIKSNNRKFIAGKNQQLSNKNVSQSMNTLRKTNPTPANIDSIKFLESMTKIYERNGRADLAQGLKSGMLKAQR